MRAREAGRLLKETLSARHPEWVEPRAYVDIPWSPNMAVVHCGPAHSIGVHANPRKRRSRPDYSTWLYTIYWNGEQRSKAVDLWTALRLVEKLAVEVAAAIELQKVKET